MNAEIAQLAERRYRKPQVGGSTPLLGSNKHRNIPQVRSSTSLLDSL